MAHLPRWPASALAAAYLQYASLGRRPAAWHLDFFEQPEGKLSSRMLLVFGYQAIRHPGIRDIRIACEPRYRFLCRTRVTHAFVPVRH
jgi:hypothetical protein